MRFRYPSMLKSHVASVHSAAAAATHHACDADGCGSSFASREELAVHVAERHPVHHVCEVCGGEFSSARNLAAHAKTHNPARSMVRCNVDGCGREFTRQSNLNAHVRAVHLKEQPYACSFGCGMRSAYKKKVEEHEAVLHRGALGQKGVKKRPASPSVKDALIHGRRRR